jgi:hypothetical protein
MSFQPTLSQISCPFCQARVTVPIQQIVDVSETPALKNAVLAGQLNMFRCPSCGNVGALAAPFLYHDPEKELAFLFLPMEAGLKQADQQRLIGSLTKAVMSKLPPEKRKAYLLQPKEFFTLQNLIDAILNADGITPEMIAAQRAKMDLLQKLADIPTKQLPAFIQQQDALIDAEFFEMLAIVTSSAQAGRAAKEYSQLLALREALLEHSTIGQKIKQQQALLTAFTSNPSRESLLEQLINAPDVQTREMLLAFGRTLLDYPFFQAMTAKIEAANAAGDKAQADKLVALRKEIQEIREKLDAAMRAMLEERASLLRQMVETKELDKFARAHLAEFDDAFFSVLETNMAAAERAGQHEAIERLQAIGEAVTRAIQSAQPPEVRFINALLSVEYPGETAQLLEANKQNLSPQFLNWMRGVAEDLRSREQAEAADRLELVIKQAAEMISTGIAVATR